MLNVDLALDHERVEIFRDPTTRAVGVVALHSTVLGPAMGGLRLHAYRSPTEATTDALRLSRAMSLKNAAAGLPLGGAYPKNAGARPSPRGGQGGCGRRGGGGPGPPREPTGCAPSAGSSTSWA